MRNARPEQEGLAGVSRFWLTYCNSSGHPFGAVVMDSSNLMHARMRSAIEVIDQGALFAQGHELDRNTAELVPTAAIGRLLNQEVAAKLIRRLERHIPKRPAAASVRRPVAGKKRSAN
jgi:hypothetical protein